MAAFINNDITAAGLLVLAKGVAGQQINYTKIVLGDGYLEEGQTPRSLTGVVSPKATIDITKCVVNGDGTVTVGGVFTNDQTNDGFYYRELGLYADDPDEDVGEVLYCYGNCGDLAEWIPPTGGATIVEKTIDIVTAIGTATKVTAYIPADAYATKEDYENYKAIALAAQATANQAILLAQQAVEIAQHCRAADVDVLHRVGERAVGLGGDRFERVQVQYQQIDRGDAVFCHHRIIGAGAAEQAAVHHRMQGLDPAVHHFREAGEIGHVLDRQAGLADRLGGAAGGQQLDVAGSQGTGQIDQAGLVGNGQQSPAYGQQIRRHGEAGGSGSGPIL